MVSYNLGKALQSIISLHLYSHAMQTQKTVFFYLLFYEGSKCTQIFILKILEEMEGKAEEKKKMKTILSMHLDKMQRYL